MPSQSKQCRSWDIRASMESYTKEELFKFCNKYFMLWVFQGEQGKQQEIYTDENGEEFIIKEGYKHWQMRVRLPDKKALYKKGILKLFELDDLKLPNYVKPTCTTVHGKKDFNYVLKEDTRITDTYSDKVYMKFLSKDDITFDATYYDAFYNNPLVYVPKSFTLKYNDLYPFQKQILESGNIFDVRGINFIIDIDGDNGKSSIASYVRYGNHGISLPPYGDSEKIIYSLCDILIDLKNREPKLIIFDLPRAIDKTKLSSFIATLEMIKQGHVSDPRHAYKDWEFEKPAMWIFSNNDVNLSNLTLGRWKLWKIENKELVRLSFLEYESLCNDIEFEKKYAKQCKDARKKLGYQKFLEKKQKEDIINFLPEFSFEIAEHQDIPMDDERDKEIAELKRQNEVLKLELKVQTHLAKIKTVNK